MPKWMAGVALVLAVGTAPLACDGGGDDQDMGGAPNDEDGTGGKGSSTGGNGSSTGGKGSGTGGDGGEDGTGGGNDGTGGGSTSDASIDDLIGAICEWEYGCCDEGEVTYRLGTAAGSSVEDCIEFFTFQLHDSNATNNPFPGGSAQGLLGVLAYTVNLDRVDENAAGIGECIDAYKAMDCPTKGEGEAFCTEPGSPDEEPCALVNLFKPALKVGDRCSLGLAEGATNDVECPAGTTCLDAADPDNPEDFPVCVQRGEDADPCNADSDCDYNFYCAPNSRCTEKGDIGDDCTFNDDDPIPGDEDAGCKAGLACDPKALVCVNSCTEDFPCQVNAQCPEGLVCAPVTVGSDSTSWKQCVTRGTSASARCDEDADCAANRYCDGNVCQGDVDIGDDCERDEMCEAGSFCDRNPFDSEGAGRVAPLVCTTLYQAAEPCLPPNADSTISTGCAPAAPYCLFDSADSRWECVAKLRAEDADCYPLGDSLSECAAGLRCEATDLAATWVYTCTAGAELDDDCDADYGDDEDLDCGPGLTCKEGVCIAQVGPGSDCEDLDDNTAGDPTLCTNSSCMENWDENGPDFICSDAPVPESNGGDGLTCGE